jgi:exosome complex component RRP4
MFSISTRPPLAAIPIFEDSHTGNGRYEDDSKGMDIDDDYGEGSSGGIKRSVVGPGEGITSSKEYMR